MALRSVQIRLTAQQVEMIDSKVKAGDYPSRSEAVRDFVRRAKFFDRICQFFDAVGNKSLLETDRRR